MTTETETEIETAIGIEITAVVMTADMVNDTTEIIQNQLRLLTSQPKIVRSKGPHQGRRYSKRASKQTQKRSLKISREGG